VVLEAGGPRFLGPALAGAGDHHHAVAAAGQPAGEVAELDRRAGVEVSLGVDLEEPERLAQRDSPGPVSPA
jgi:hypothetical protein